MFKELVCLQLKEELYTFTYALVFRGFFYFVPQILKIHAIKCLKGFTGCLWGNRSVGFQIYGGCVLPAIPVILKSPHSDFRCNICREFDLLVFYRDTPH